mgnify:FL=1
MKRILPLLAVALLAIVACSPSAPSDNTSSPVFDNISTNQTDTNTTLNGSNTTSSLNGSVDYQISGTEGEVITLPLRATDPDGDDITYAYEDPFNEDGVWETNLGDEGTYVVDVNASDGLRTTTATVLVTVNRANRAPVVDCPSRFTFPEGELATINCDIYDPEGDRVVVTYQGWTTSRTKRVGYDDAGNYSVVITARDTQNNTVERTVPVTVTDTNRAPEITDIEDRSVQETSTFSIDPEVSDPDGDDVSVNYTAPLSNQGIWETSYGDAGEYDITVVASDGEATAKETFTLTVDARNQAPVIRPLDNITVDEGETVTIRPEAYDPDGDDVELDYSGWMESNQYTTDFEDAYPDGCNEKGCTAAYTVFVTATDGELTSQEELTVFVDDTNRAPQFSR